MAELWWLINRTFQNKKEQKMKTKWKYSGKKIHKPYKYTLVWRKCWFIQSLYGPSLIIKAWFQWSDCTVHQTSHLFFCQILPENGSLDFISNVAMVTGMPFYAKSTVHETWWLLRNVLTVVKLLFTCFSYKFKFGLSYNKMDQSRKGKPFYLYGNSHGRKTFGGMGN